jgi:hypothetical protein
MNANIIKDRQLPEMVKAGNDTTPRRSDATPKVLTSGRGAFAPLREKILRS